MGGVFRKFKSLHLTFVPKHFERHAMYHSNKLCFSLNTMLMSDRCSVSFNTRVMQ